MDYYTTCKEIIRREDWSRNIVTVSFDVEGKQKLHFEVEVDVMRGKASPVSIKSCNALASMQLEHFTRWLRDGNVAAEL